MWFTHIIIAPDVSPRRHTRTLICKEIYANIWSGYAVSNPAQILFCYSITSLAQMLLFQTKDKISNKNYTNIAPLL